MYAVNSFIYIIIIVESSSCTIASFAYFLIEGDSSYELFIVVIGVCYLSRCVPNCLKCTLIYGRHLDSHIRRYGKGGAYNLPYLYSFVFIVTGVPAVAPSVTLSQHAHRVLNTLAPPTRGASTLLCCMMRHMIRPRHHLGCGLDHAATWGAG